MVNVVLPAESVCDNDVYPPPDNVTDPVGVPLEPVTVTATLTLWFERMLLGVAVAATVAIAVPVAANHAFTTLATFSEPSPVASS